MKNRRLLCKLMIFLSVFTLCICTFTPYSEAMLQNKGSISLHVADLNTKEPLENVSFCLYFIASAYEDGGEIRYSYLEAYKKLYIDIDIIEDAYISVHLMNYSRVNNVEHTIRTTDKNGNMIFDGLTPGIYLVTPSENAKEYFTPSPFVVRIPFYDADKQSISFDVEATPKMRALASDDYNYTTYITVEKVWDTKTEHPDEITVSLLRDFTEAETVILSEENNWSYRWDDLPVFSVWSVVEARVPDGYEVAYEVSSNTVKIINKSVSSEETTTESEATTEPVSEPVNEPESETERDELADTGQLNWPVPVLAISGILVFSLGWAMLNFGKKEIS